MSRCQNCNKFTALEMQDPDVESFDVEFDLDAATGELSINASGTVRIVRTSECCGGEMKEASLELTEESTVPREALGDLVVQAAGLWVWRDGVEPGYDHDDPQPIEEGGGRYAKSYFGAEVTYRVTVGDKVVHEATLSDKCAASGMDELS